MYRLFLKFIFGGTYLFVWFLLIQYFTIAGQNPIYEAIKGGSLYDHKYFFSLEIVPDVTNIIYIVPLLLAFSIYEVYTLKRNRIWLVSLTIILNLYTIFSSFLDLPLRPNLDHYCYIICPLILPTTLVALVIVILLNIIQVLYSLTQKIKK